MIDDDSVRILMDRMNAMVGELRNASDLRLPIHYIQVGLGIRMIGSIISFIYISSSPDGDGSQDVPVDSTHSPVLAPGLGFLGHAFDTRSHPFQIADISYTQPKYQDIRLKHTGRSHG